MPSTCNIQRGAAAPRAPYPLSNKVPIMTAALLKTLVPQVADRTGRVLHFLWSGWAGLAALCLLTALCQAGHEAYGPFILTSPLDTMRAIGTMAVDPAAWQIAQITFQRALAGFAMATGVGIAIGLTSGYSPATMRLASPLITVLLGLPPIA